jgi:hypothetical protein
MKISFVAARRLGPTLQLAGLLLLTGWVWWLLGRSSDQAKTAAAAARSQVQTAVSMGEFTRLMEKAWQRTTRDEEEQAARINELGAQFYGLMINVASLPHWSSNCRKTRGRKKLSKPRRKAVRSSSFSVAKSPA